MDYPHHNPRFGGNVGTWFTTTVAGLDTVSNATSSGWRDIVIAPTAAALVHPKLPHATATQLTRFGLASVSWARSSTTQGKGIASRVATVQLSLNCSIPPGSTATIYLPVLNSAGSLSAVMVQEGKVTVWKDGKFQPQASVPGFHSGRSTVRDNRTTVALAVGSGNFTLVASL